MDRDGRAGMTLVELVIVLAMVGVLLATASWGTTRWFDDQRAATSGRTVTDAFNLARGEALRTGSNHIVAFDIESGLSGISADVVVANDGPNGTSNCRIEAGEVVHTFSLERGVGWGTDPSLADATPAPDDVGASGNQATGSSFTDAGAGDASWVLFSPDGLPHLFTENGSTTPPCDDLGPLGTAAGAIYLTNGRGDYSVVLSPLGTVRLHRWNPSREAWSQ